MTRLFHGLFLDFPVSDVALSEDISHALPRLHNPKILKGASSPSLSYVCEKTIMYERNIPGDGREAQAATKRLYVRECQ